MRLESRLPLLFILFYCSILFVSCHNDNKNKGLIIGAAASTQYVLEALIQRYQSQKELPIETVISSSGKLTAQIEHGAPIDIFISADTLYPNYLFKKGIGAKAPIIYAYGQLVLWTLETYDLKLGIQTLTDPRIKKIAMADSKTAPYGRLSSTYLKEQKVYDSVMDKIILGESIGQVNQYITTKNADLGLTAKSVVMAPQLKNNGTFVVLEDAILAQSMLLLKRSASKEAIDFYTFLQSDEAKTIFEAYGYVVTPNNKL